jgi:DNA-binding Lrp family transcriptional regulator
LKELDPGKMPMAFILINVEAGSEDEVIQELKAIDNVRNVYSVYGVYDIVAKVEAKTQQELKQTITWKVRRLERIRSTQTLMISS